MDNYSPECHIPCKKCGKTMRIDDVDRNDGYIDVYHLCDCSMSAIEKRKNKQRVNVIWYDEEA